MMEQLNAECNDSMSEVVMVFKNPKSGCEMRINFFKTCLFGIMSLSCRILLCVLLGQRLVSSHSNRAKSHRSRSPLFCLYGGSMVGNHLHAYATIA